MSRRVCLYLHRLDVANPTGIHRYSVELATALTQTATGGDAVELWSGRQDRPARADGFTARQPRARRRPLHLAWTVARRPLFERIAGAPDVVHELAPVVTLPTRAPLVVTVHDLLPLTQPQWYPPRERWINGRALRYAADCAVRVITPSRVIADEVRDTLGIDADRIVAIPEGVDARFAEPAAPDTVSGVLARWRLTPGEFLVIVGEIGPRKNVPVVIRALQRLRAQAKTVPTVVVVGGDGQDAHRVHALVDELGLRHHVRFTGRVRDDELRVLVQAARALLHPSTFEGFGLTVLEAMAAGTAVVVSAAGALPELVGGAGALVDARDVDAWAHALQRVGADDDWVTSLARAGRERASGFTWTAAATRTWQVYDDVTRC